MVFQRLFNKPSIEEVSAEEAKAKQKAGAMIVDVREPSEWREGYTPVVVIHLSFSALAQEPG
jgi:rhodanese-related sulfurtransferase